MDHWEKPSFLSSLFVDSNQHSVYDTNYAYRVKEIKREKKFRLSSSTISSLSSCSSEGEFIGSSSNKSRSSSWISSLPRLKPVRTSFPAEWPVQGERNKARGYGDLKKIKKSITSPGGKIVKFIGSLFHPGSSKKADRSEKNALITKLRSGCPSNITGGSKRFGRLCPVITEVVNEDCHLRAHKYVDREKNRGSDSQRFRGVEDIAGDMFKEYRKDQRDVYKEDDDDDMGSYSSSDLFELENLAAIGVQRYGEELPVFGTTNVGCNAVISNRFVLKLVGLLLDEDGADWGRNQGGRIELLRENKRMLDKSIREIERERQSLQTQEKKLIMEIKKSAKQGQMGAVKVMAKDLIRTRHQVEKFYKLKSQLQGVALRIQPFSLWIVLLFNTEVGVTLAFLQTLKSTQAMGEAMKGVTKAMGQMNRQMNLPSLQKIMQEFERQNEKMEMVSEVMGDAIDDALEGDEEEEETEDLVSQVLDEIGIDINQELVNAPASAVATPAAKNKVAQAEATSGGHDDGGIDNDLQARLDNLRKM
ncbi:hypothetical protein GIB67_002385 [Kingdonia uniflora]|uniref:Uncharacterized protein n=1 Tax=Kingdonia uniflora TaxID=39325 RepID=A0A7J7M8D5_9MAGN|nr:hypothetical protein GIB67_002385 [Kingdonia uniflora]